MTGQLSALAQGKAAGAPAGYTSKLLKTAQTTQYDSELDDGYYEKGVARSYTANTTGQYSSTTTVDLTHLVSDTGAFTSADKTYTDAGKCGVFKAAGGETIIISGSGSNNGTFTTVSATANTVVFSQTIVDEADAPSTTFKKRESVTNNTVTDNNTGLMWLKDVIRKMGVAGGGLMPWTGVDYDIFACCAACNAASLAGHTDWRVPNFFEMNTLFTFEPGSSRPSGTYFTTVTGGIWTSTVSVGNTAYAMAITSSYDYASGKSAKTNAYYLWLVRG